MRRLDYLESVLLPSPSLLGLVELGLLLLIVVGWVMVVVVVLLVVVRRIEY